MPGTSARPRPFSSDNRSPSNVDWRIRFRRLRIAVLLLVLAGVGLSQWAFERRIRTWLHPIRIVLIPISAEPDPAVDEYAERLSKDIFEPVSRFLAREAERHGLGYPLEITFSVAASRHDLPPLPPAEVGPVQAVLYSLKLRWWNLWVLGRADLPPHDIRMALVLHRATPNATIDHSLGLMRGQIAIVHGLADERFEGILRVVVAHELMHIAGAEDLYDSRGRPRYPAGYVNPALGRDQPQSQAALMAGMLPLGRGAFRLPTDLYETRIVESSARKVGWLWNRAQSPPP
ncbi:MAG: hypothetical protein ACFB9M_09485 [Myxococcota bacterium]